MKGVHWHIGQNVPGYLSESDVDTVGTKAEAVQYLVERKRSWIDNELEPYQYRFDGNARTDLGYWVTDTLAGEHHLGYVIWASQCDCDEGEHVVNPSPESRHPGTYCDICLTDGT